MIIILMTQIKMILILIKMPTNQGTSGSSLTASITAGTQHDRTRAFVQVPITIVEEMISKCPLLRVHCSLQCPIAPLPNCPIAQLPFAQGSCQEASQAPSSRPLPKCPSAPSLQGSQVKSDPGPDVDPDPEDLRFCNSDPDAMHSLYKDRTQ